MNKDIHYSGYTALPSDYECPDGELALSLNLINENQSISPLPLPAPVLQLVTGEKLLFVHNVPGQTNYILARPVNDTTTKIYWLMQSDTTEDTAGAVLIATIDTPLDVTAVGNTVVFATDAGLYYLLWKDAGYKPLGNRPPFVSIDFGMDPVSTLNNSASYTIPSSCVPGQNGAGANTPVRIPSNEDLATVTELTFSLLNPAVADITTKGYFYQPFFIRYAFRLYDGSYNWHSVPILMLPTVIPPIIKCVNGSESNTVTLTLDVPYFSLAYRILADGLTALSDWSDLVSGIDIFVSNPIYTYNQSKNLTRFTNSLRSILLQSCWNGYNEYSPRGSSATVPSSVFVGHYKDHTSSRYIDHAMSTAATDSYTVVNIQQHEKFRENLRDAHDFYKIAEIDIKDIKAMSDMESLKLNTSDLSNLLTRETLPDDYQSHCKITASSLYLFNSRLNLADTALLPAKPFPLRSCTEFSNPAGSETKNMTITVWTRANGVKCKAVYTGSTLLADVVYNPASNFPRHIFYPDASAYKMQISFTGGATHVINLTTHDFLNGAYWLNDDFLVNTIPENTEAESTECGTMVATSSKIYTSQVNNPFVFPLLGINTIGSGRVYRLSSAAKALSQGQFGQFPLYAFTDEGVWALEVSSTGTISARQPITRDVCINPDGITQIDSAVLVPTDRGIMLLSGSSATCISDAVNDETPFDITSLPGINTLHAMLGHTDQSCLPLMPFSDFLSRSGMIYDYPHQRIIVYNPDCTYAYIFSLKSKLWGMSYSTICNNVNSYPEALATTVGGLLVNFAKTPADIDLPPGLLVTRPLKLDAPDLLKTIDNIIQRGTFSRGHVKSTLYGSRDLVNWHLVWSSNDHFLRGFRGSPYKYFRIALVCNLSPGESIRGASVQFSPRLANQPR